MDKKMRRLFSVVLSFAMLITTAVTNITPVQSVQAATQTQETAVKASNSYGLADNCQDGTILHCFNWTYKDIIAELPAIAQAGFTSIQTSPAQTGCSTGTWYWLYQPLGFYCTQNDLGTRDELKQLCDKADEYGIKVIVDVVANHLAGNHSNIQDDLKPSNYWHTLGGVPGDKWTDRYWVTKGDIGMQDIATENDYVEQVVYKYIQDLKTLGVDGIRFDAAKHIGLPSEGDNFWKVVTADRSLFYYGEILGGPDDRPSGNEGLMEEYTTYISVTDSNYGKLLRDSFNSGSAPTSYANWAARGITSDKLVYWGESHDTWSNNKDWGYSNEMSNNVIDRAYALAASRYQATALYFSRPASKVKDDIKAGQKGSTHFKSAEVAAVNHLHNATVGQKDYFTSGSNCSVVCRETGAVVVAGSGGDFEVTVPNGGNNGVGLTKPGTYYDEITGNKWEVTSTTMTGKIGSTGIAVFYEEANPEPSATVSNGSTSSVTNYTSDTLDVEIGLKNAISGTYSIDGKNAVTFTSKKTITLGEGKNVGDTTTLTLTATDGTNTSTPVTYTYMKVEPSHNIAYIELPSGWNEPYCYVYETIDGVVENNGEWPGVKMEKVSGNIYKYEVDEKFSTPNVIFTDNTNQYPGANQDGLILSGSMIYQNGSWKAYNVVKTGWVKADGKWYYYTQDGEKLKGWNKIEGKWYYLDNSGAMQIGWTKLDGKWYYTDINGVMQIGWTKIGSTWYYMDINGVMQTGWIKSGNNWYYMDINGVMQTGWIKSGNKWYFMDASGTMQSSKWIQGIYYVKADGSMAVSEWVENGKYFVDSNGVWVPNKRK